jgi:hypothetical protein
MRKLQKRAKVFIRVHDLKKRALMGAIQGTLQAEQALKNPAARGDGHFRHPDLPNCMCAVGHSLPKKWSSWTKDLDFDDRDEAMKIMILHDAVLDPDINDIIREERYKELVAAL